jgi:hypothetical protein
VPIREQLRQLPPLAACPLQRRLDGRTRLGLWLPAKRSHNTHDSDDDDSI